MSQLLDTLQKIATVLQEEGEPAQSLVQLAGIVRDHMGADHAKVFVVQRGKGRFGLEQICRTDDQAEQFDRKLTPIRGARGLANWVVSETDWLAVPKVPEEWPKKDTPFPVISGCHGEFERAAHYEQESFPSPLDEEETMLLVPLRAGRHTAGVLAVWRNRHPSNNPGEGNQRRSFGRSQAEDLLRTTPFVTASCQQILQRRALEDELKQVSELAGDLHHAASLSAAYQAVARRVGELSQAAHTLLLHHDPDRPGTLYARAAWSAPGEAVDVAERFRGFHVHFPSDEKQWRARIRDRVKERLDPATDKLAAYEGRIHGPSATNKPELLAVLLDHRKEQETYGVLADDSLAHTACSFLSYADSMLRNHIQTYAQRLVDALGQTKGAASWKPDQVLGEAARMLREATGASGALVYSGPGEKLVVSGSSPERKKAHGWNVTAESLTNKSISSKRPERVVDIGDANDTKAREMDHQRLEKIRQVFGWQDLRSWLACPVLDRGRCVGVLKLLTADQDVFLGKDHEALAQAVAERASWEIRKLNRRLLLEELNLLANELTQARGEKLGKKIIEKLEAWSARFLRVDTEVALFTRTPPDHSLIDRVSDSLEVATVGSLRRLSRHLGWEELVWSDGRSVATSMDGWIQLKGSGAAIPIPLPDRSSIQGHLMFLHQDPFSDAEQDAAREAAREIGIVLHSERLTQHWKEQAGRFRHAVIGPVQGLQSAALELTELAAESADESAAGTLAEIGRQIREEVELIRLWRYNQRLYTKETVKVTRRVQPLQRLFERCIRRYEPIAAERSIAISSAWRPYGQVRFAFDEEAIDLVLSNLLDNAVKYSFRETKIDVGLIVEEHRARLWVHNVGHRIPQRLDEQIYRVAKRLDWDDPFRSIEGQGLGLPMAKAIVDAHDGTIRHTSVRWIKGRRKETEPYKVRFVVELPTGRKA